MFLDYIEKIEAGDGDLKQFTKAYENFGIHVQNDNSVVAKEWAPGAQEVFLTGDFSKNLILYFYLYHLRFCHIFNALYPELHAASN